MYYADFVCSFLARLNECYGSMLLRVCADSTDDIEDFIIAFMMELIMQVMVEDATSCRQHKNKLRA